MDVRIGGLWRFAMRGPDGRDHPNRVVYNAVVPPTRLVYTHLSAPPFAHTVASSAEGPTTRVRVEMVFPSEALRDQAVAHARADHGLRQTLAHLAQHLATR